MSKIVLIDTNLYLDDANIINKLSSNGETILIPLMVLKELDKHKYNSELSYSARNAIRAILDFINNNEVIFDVNKYEEDKDPDGKIISSAKAHGASLSTKDISMHIIAKSVGIESTLHDMVLNNIFNPYVYTTTEALFKEGKEFSFKSDYSGEQYYAVIDYLKNNIDSNITTESWWFLIIDNRTVYANNPMSYEFVHIDNKPQYRQMSIDKDKEGTIKAMDIYQVCAIYAMKEAPNALVCGSYGSGKSLLATMYALSHNDRKTFISRPNLTVDRRFELGFLPGSMADKLSPWMAGFMSSLYYIFSNTKAQVSDKMHGTYDYVKETVFDKYFEMIPLETLQGMSFMDGDLLLLDESQLCSISILSVILSRFGKGSKLIMTGDVKQTYNVIKPSENGLLKLLRLLPNKCMAYVELKNNYRSDLLELADGLQNKSF